MVSIFPFPKTRKNQDKLIKIIEQVLENHSSAIIHAPTGLGKTAAILSPAIELAINKNKKILFLTSKQTQHFIVLDTIKRINQKYNMNILALSLIGKRQMCAYNMSKISTKDFFDFCRIMKERKECAYYLNTREPSVKLSTKAKLIVAKIKKFNQITADMVYNIAISEQLCPYEIAMAIVRDANVIICDYNYVFNPFINAFFMKRLGKSLHDTIIIVDEAHNLPSRIMDFMSDSINTTIIKRARDEAKRYQLDQVIPIIDIIEDSLLLLSYKNFEEQEEIYQHLVFNEPMISGEHLAKKEARVSRQDFNSVIEELLSGTGLSSINELIIALTFASEIVKEHQVKSYISSLASFLMNWQTSNQGYARYLTIVHKQHKGPNEYLTKHLTNPDENINLKNKINGNTIPKSWIRSGKLTISISISCLDPSLVSSNLVNSTYSTILMSGTLLPPQMYSDLLGFDENTSFVILPNPFPEENRLDIIVPLTTTRYIERNQKTYEAISSHITKLIKIIPGNIIIYFPSYEVLNIVYTLIYKHRSKKHLKKMILVEKRNMSLEERHSIIKEMKNNYIEGAVLFACINGSFSESIDLPGKYLNGVIIVGIPLPTPNIRMQDLIDYYETRFGNGLEYAYLYPTFNKIMQAAGRAIRTEKDRAVVVYLDKRYIWGKYFKYIRHFNPIIKEDYVKLIKKFFDLNSDSLDEIKSTHKIDTSRLEVSELNFEDASDLFDVDNLK